jgi:hypothetical protein
MPLGIGSKIPQTKSWKSLQTIRATKERVEEFFTKFPNSNLAIITGEISDLTILDFDDKLPLTLAFVISLETYSVETPHGYHAYFKHAPVKNAVKVKLVTPDGEVKFDVRSDGGYVVAPPSIVDANMYSVFLDQEIQKLPKNILSKLTAPKDILHNKWEDIVNSTGNGERNMNAASLTGLLLKRLPSDEWTSIARPLIRAWNKQNVTPPLSDEELDRTFDSIAKRELSTTYPQKGD